jgi:hypothetical protein
MSADGVCIHATTHVFITDFRFSQLLIIDVNSVLGLLHRLVAGDAVDVSEVHAAFVFNMYP